MKTKEQWAGEVNKDYPLLGHVHIIEQIQKDARAELEQDKARLVEVLRELHDFQNGCPLEKYRQPLGTRHEAV